jgi:kynurenine formamidase
LHCSIDKMAKGIVGRGVLLDIARLRGVDWMQAGEVITPDDLDAAVAAQHVEVRSGDIVFFRTGWRSKFIIRDMGMTLGEILDLDELAEDCASDGVYEFFTTAPPIKFTNAVGSPINPLAIK